MCFCTLSVDWYKTMDLYSSYSYISSLKAFTFLTRYTAISLCSSMQFNVIGGSLKGGAAFHYFFSSIGPERGEGVEALNTQKLKKG